MLDDPRVNFAISARGRAAGVDHLGIQVEDQGELHEVYGRLDQAGRPGDQTGRDRSAATRSSQKSWIDDPAGISWETFLTTGESTNYGDGSGERGVQIRSERRRPRRLRRCCGPKVEVQAEKVRQRAPAARAVTAERANAKSAVPGSFAIRAVRCAHPSHRALPRRHAVPARLSRPARCPSVSSPPCSRATAAARLKPRPEPGSAASAAGARSARRARAVGFRECPGRDRRP